MPARFVDPNPAGASPYRLRPRVDGGPLALGVELRFSRGDPVADAHVCLRRRHAAAEAHLCTAHCPAPPCGTRRAGG